MTEAPSTRYFYLPLLHAQIELVEARRARVAAEAGGEHDAVLVDAIANDLVGARIVIRTALAAPSPYRVSGVEREALERQEQEAGDILRVVLGII